MLFQPIIRQGFDNMRKEEKPTKEATSRRDFFKLAGVGAASAAAATIGGKPSEAEAASADRKDRGYQLTDHVKKAYSAARF